MTVLELSEHLAELAEDPRLADLEIFISKVTAKGAQLRCPVISKEYGRSEEFVTYVDYCVLPFSAKEAKS
jgi:hypothetical protein